MTEENQEELLRLIEQINLNTSIVSRLAWEHREWASDENSKIEPARAAEAIIIWNMDH